ncbi:MAG: histidine phosphatase family protein [Planctomycetales bacterium]|nr:histidine phosphatase family protein [Planctomycetales bacterium]
MGVLIRRRDQLLFPLSVLLVAAALAATAIHASDASADNETVVFIVRHGEKVDSSDDAALSELGQTRAQELARVLADAEIDYVHSTGYARTKGTAAPLAKVRGLKTQAYDRADAKLLVSKIRKLGGRHLVVGHSSSIRSVIRELGGEPGKPINVEGEYDRLYVITIAHDGHATTTLLRYGEPYRAAVAEVVGHQAAH